MSYTEALNVFSPDGRLIQVEYAHHASEQGSLITANVTTGAVIICIEKKTAIKNLISKSKLLKVAENIYFSYSGLASDAQTIFTRLSLFYHNYKIETDTYPDISLLAMELGVIKFKYTIEGGKRPFGVRSILVGFDDKPRVFIIEPDGNYGEYNNATLGYKNDKVEFNKVEVQNKHVTLHKKDETISSDLTNVVYNDLFMTVKSMSDAIKIDHKRIECFIVTKENCYLVSEDTIKDIINE
ncbi:hypothetical protein H312_02252 [Anncaliia algerae PRA339]|uniref:Proteasome subunit alpha type n=1 Tax=Anncaliia algerae PRA339 TaxID=1288291 RepID=A0A059EZJ5_9MICR|nr:hypothetical protein H312_02252 [Anncaliia algerae PRA339]